MRSMREFSPDRPNTVHDVLNGWMFTWRTCWADNYRRLPAMLMLAGLLLSIGAAAFAQGTLSSSNVLRRGWLGAPASKGTPHAIRIRVPEPASGIGDGARDGDDRETNQAMQPSPHPITDQ
jgi:hypothetical protein